MTDDEHIAELQRMAYGADTPDTVRARASAELAELAAAAGGRHPSAAATARDVAAVAEGVPDPGTGPESTPDGTTGERRPDPAGPDPVVDDGVRRWGGHWTAIAGVAGLLVGAALGVAGSRLAPAESEVTTADIAPTGPRPGSGEPGTPLQASGLLLLFDRLPPVEETGEVELAAAEDLDPASVRLLASRADGPTAYLARTSDGTDVCLVLLLPQTDAPRGRCTTGGMMPVQGLRISHAAPSLGFVVAILNPSGTITLGLNAGR